MPTSDFYAAPVFWQGLSFGFCLLGIALIGLHWITSSLGLKRLIMRWEPASNSLEDRLRGGSTSFEELGLFGRSAATHQHVVVGDPFHGLQQLSHLLRGLHVDQSSPQGGDGLVGPF